MISKYNCIAIICVVFFCCCNSSTLRRDIELLSAKPIIIPDIHPVLYNNCKTNISNLTAPSRKMVIYIDSSECASCSIKQMNGWDSVISKTIEFADKINFYFIFAPKKIDVITVKRTLIAEGFKHPVLIDTLRQFEKLNPHLPKNKALHTFLLDENNNVILVGNPLHNKKIEEMFYKIVEEKLGKPQKRSIEDSAN